MQGYLILDGGDATETVCKQCFDNGITFKVNTKSWVYLGSDIKFEIECCTCDTLIDGVLEEPKPESFTVTIEVVVYADEDIVTAADAGDYVADIMAGYCDNYGVTDVKEHF